MVTIVQIRIYFVHIDVIVINDYLNMFLTEIEFFFLKIAHFVIQNLSEKTSKIDITRSITNLNFLHIVTRNITFICNAPET